MLCRRNCESFGGSTNADVNVAQQTMAKRTKIWTLMIDSQFE